MKMLESDYKKRRRTGRIIRYILIALIPIFLLGLFIGKSYSAPKEKIGEERIQKDVMEKVDAPKPEEVTPPEPPRVEKGADGKPLGKFVYLTFDDGPSKLTGQFLDILREENVKATFFMQGTNLKKEHLQASVKRATEEGHYVGAHSMTHEYKTLYKEGQFVPEMNDTLALIQDITGTTPNLVRPPYGSMPGLKSDQMRDQIANEGMKVWDWTIDSNDWSLKGKPDEIVKTVKNETNMDIEVVLMHEKIQTLEALREIIAFYREQGYEFAVYNDADHFDLNFLNDARL